MIIWLASYPKSGNTWLRSIICSLLYTKDGRFTNSERELAKSGVNRLKRLLRTGKKQLEAQWKTYDERNKQ